MPVVGIGAMNKAILDAIGLAEDQTILVMKALIEDAYDTIIGLSPTFTFYYASNHRITIRDSERRIKVGDAEPELFPAEKLVGTPRNFFAANIALARAKEIAKLDKLELGDTVRISTSVPYAAEIEQNHSVYTGAEHVFSF